MGRLSGRCWAWKCNWEPSWDFALTGGSTINGIRNELIHVLHFAQVVFRHAAVGVVEG